MTAVTELGYVGLTITSPADWQRFATEVVGLEWLDEGEGDRFYLRMDYWHHRLVLHAGDSVRELLSLDPRAWPRVLDVSAEIAAGSWLLNRPDDNEPDDEPTLAEVNLAVTSALVCAAI